MSYCIKFFLIFSFLINFVDATEDWEEVDYVQETPHLKNIEFAKIQNKKDLDNLNFYVNKIRSYHISIEQTILQKKKNIVLTFNPSNWIFSLLRNDYVMALDPVLFPKLETVSVIINISHRYLSLDELKQAVKLTETHPCITNFIFKEISIWDFKKKQECKQQHLLTAFVRRNALLNESPEIFYEFYHDSSYQESHCNDFEEELIIADAIKNSLSIKSLEMIFEGERGLEILKNLIDKSFIQCINFCFYRKMKKEEIYYLSSFFDNNYCLEFLKLDVLINEKLLYSLANMLEKNLLKKLNLTTPRAWKTQQSVSNEAFEAFFKSIGLNKSLEILQLECIFPLEGLKFLSDSLKINTVLKTIALFSHNGIKDFGLNILAKGIKENISLTEIDISHNGITDAGADIIIDMINVNSNLKHVWLGENYFGVENNIEHSPRELMFFNTVSSLKRGNIQQLLQKRQHFDFFVERRIDFNDFDLDPGLDVYFREIDSDVNFYRSSSSSSSSATFESDEDDIP